MHLPVDPKREEKGGWRLAFSSNSSRIQKEEWGGGPETENDINLLSYLPLYPMEREKVSGVGGGGEEEILKEYHSCTHLLDTILDVGLHLLLRPQETLPELVADAAALEQGIERLFARAHVDDPVNVFGATGQESGAEKAVRHLSGGRVMVL